MLKLHVPAVLCILQDLQRPAAFTIVLLVSACFSKFAALLGEVVPSYEISAVAIEVKGHGFSRGIVPHLMTKHFGARSATSADVTKVTGYVKVDPVKHGSIIVGSVRVPEPERS